MNWMRGSQDDQFDALLRAYRVACPTPEPSVNFMPQLWARIESRQRNSFSFRRMANALVTAALAATVLLGVYTATPHRKTADYSITYVEALAAANSIETPDIVAPVRLDLSESGR